MIEYRESEPKLLPIKSKDNWISLNDFVPSNFSSSERAESYCGRYYCIVERELKKEENCIWDSKREFSRSIESSIELCYWNNLAKKFQDSSREYVNVSHWCPVPEMPKRTVGVVDRTYMLEQLNLGLFEKVYESDQERYGDDLIRWENEKKEFSLFHVSHDEVIFLSVVVNEAGFENCLWCIKK